MVLTRASSSRLGTPLASPLPDPDRPLNPITTSNTRHGTISARDRVLALRRLSADSGLLLSPTTSASTSASSPPSPTSGSTLELSSQFSLIQSRLEAAQPRSPPSPLPLKMPNVDTNFLGGSDERLVTPKRSSKTTKKGSAKVKTTPKDSEKNLIDSDLKRVDQSNLDMHYEIDDDHNRNSPVLPYDQELDFMVLDGPIELETKQNSLTDQAVVESVPESRPKQGPLGIIRDFHPEQLTEKLTQDCLPDQPPSECVKLSHSEEPQSEPTPDCVFERNSSEVVQPKCGVDQAQSELVEGQQQVQSELVTGISVDLSECQPLTISCPQSTREVASVQALPESIQPASLESIQSDTVELKVIRSGEEMEEVCVETIRVEEAQGCCLEQNSVAQVQSVTKDTHSAPQTQDVASTETGSESVKRTLTNEPVSIAEDAMHTTQEESPEETGLNSTSSDPIEENPIAEPESISEVPAPSTQQQSLLPEQDEPASVEPIGEELDPHELVLQPISVDQIEPEQLIGDCNEQTATEPLEGTTQERFQLEFNAEKAIKQIETELPEPSFDDHGLQIELNVNPAAQTAPELVVVKNLDKVLETSDPVQPEPKPIPVEHTESKSIPIEDEPMVLDSLEVPTPASKQRSPSKSCPPNLETFEAPPPAMLLSAMEMAAPMEIEEEDVQIAQSDSATLDGQTDHTTSPQLPSTEVEEEERSGPVLGRQSRSRSSFSSTIAGDTVAEEEQEEEDVEDEASDSDAELDALLSKARERCGKGTGGGNAFVNGLDKITFEDVPENTNSVQAGPLAALVRPLTLDALTPLTGSSSSVAQITKSAPGVLPKDRFGMMPPPIKKKSEKVSKKVGWHELPQQEITPEVKREIQAMRLHGTLDPKCFVKGGIEKRLKEPIPDRFQFGHIIPSGRSSSTGTEAIPKKRSFVEALVADEEAKGWTKKKYVNEVQISGASGGKGFWKNLKKKRKKNMI